MTFVIPEIRCGFARVQKVFAERWVFAKGLLSPSALQDYVIAAEALGRMGRGEEPVLVFLEEIPQVAAQAGEAVIAEALAFTHRLARSPNSRAIVPFLQSLPAAARHLESAELFAEYLRLVMETLTRTTPKVHGIDSMYESSCLPEFLNSVPAILSQVSLAGLRNWVDYGIQGYPNDPDRQREYFSLTSADSRAILQRERHGTLFIDQERCLALYVLGLWNTTTPFVPYSLAYDTLRKPVPYGDARGVHLPDVYDARQGVAGIDRYRALIAHICAHQRWSTPLVADNFSPFQRLAIEVFEDARVEYLAMTLYPGLGKIWRALHPIPQETGCPMGWSSIRHRLAMLSRALLDPEHGYQDQTILRFVDRFHQTLSQCSCQSADMVPLGLDYITATRRQEDLSAKVWFEDTEVDYRDDNRLLWVFIEEGDEEVYENKPNPHDEQDGEIFSMPPRMYPEWAYQSQRYLPDWVSLYEHLHPSADPEPIERLLDKHAGLAKRLKKIIDSLKPHDKMRIRYQEEGSELDLDIAVRSMIDFKSGAQPDPRINMSHKTDGRRVAVSLLLDLSASLGDIPEGCGQSKLQLAQEAVALLAWAVDQMGDPLAIGGFYSDSRHDVRYLHIKGYRERWSGDVKSRLAAMEAGYSTRMGAALRHAGHYLVKQEADKRLLLVLTDGEPADIDTPDPRVLVEDARIAVRELDAEGVNTYCINLDPHADDYIEDIFGFRYTVIDHVARLPERLTTLFMTLIK